MTRAILLTGAPGSGKTTLICRILAGLSISASGFYTQELRAGGARQGFEIITLDGRRGTLAHVNIGGRHRVGKYGVDLAALEAIGVAAIREAVAGGKLVVIDEIGPMEMLSEPFRRAVVEALDSPSPVLGAIARRSTPFTDAIKARPDVTVIEVTPANRDALPAQIISRLQKSVP
jgi:nucleoside-triphosphatase